MSAWTGGIGAHRAAREMSERLGVTIRRDGIELLAERGLVEPDGDFKGCQLYSTASLAQVSADDAAAAARDAYAARLLNRKEAAAHLRIRQADCDRLIRAGLIKPDKTPAGKWQGTVLLFYPATLDAFAARPDIDWAAVRATPGNKRTPLYDLAEPYLILNALAGLPAIGPPA